MLKKHLRTPLYCVNPDTGRDIRIGGSTWMKLVKTNKIDEETGLHSNVAYTTEETYEDNNDEVMAKLEEQKKMMIANGQVPAHKTLQKSFPKKGVRKRGQLFYRTKNTSAKDASQNTANAAMEIIDEIQGGRMEIPTDMNRDEARNYLQGLIFNKMVAEGKKFKNLKMEPTGAPLEQSPKYTKSGRYKMVPPKKVRKPKAKKKAPPPSSSEESYYEEETTEGTEYETEDTEEPESSETDLEYTY